MSPQERQQQIFQQTVFTAKRMNMLVDEGAAVLIDVSPRGTGGTIFVQQATVAQPVPKSIEEMRTLTRLSYYDPKAETKMIPQVTVSAEQYNRMMRMMQQGEKLKMTVDLQVEYQDQDNMGYNTVAETLQARVRAVLVPFAAGGETEQSLRAELLAARGAAVVVPEAALRLETLAHAVNRAARAPRPAADLVDLGGAQRSAALLREWLA